MNTPLAQFTLLAWLLYVLPEVGLATPFYAVKESQNCGGCHKPGRAQRPVLERRCTLDCLGCHVDPNGAGPRNAWGYYFSQDQLSTWDFFSPQDPLEDMSRFDLHLDARSIYRQAGDEQRSFPMASELSLRLRPFVSGLHVVYQLLVMGRVGESSPKLRGIPSRRIVRKWAVMLDDLPMNLYVRWARGTPVYGLRHSNHALWIREQIGLDYFALQDSLAVGGSPNVPFFHINRLMGEPDRAPEDQQRGHSAHFGLRGVSFGWHVHASLWSTQSERTGIEMQAIGAGAHVWPLTLQVQRNFRVVRFRGEEAVLQNGSSTGPQTGSSASSQASSQAGSRLHPTSTIDDLRLALSPLPGLTGGAQFEALVQPFRRSWRRSLFLQWNPVPFLQFEVWQRFESGSRSLRDTLVIGHVYGDL